MFTQDQAPIDPAKVKEIEHLKEEQKRKEQQEHERDRESKKKS
jgi:hypothetical protein